MEATNALIASFLNGDAQATEVMRGWIRIAAGRYRGVLAREDIEDLEQEVILDLVSSLSRDAYRGESNLRTYVRAHVHHKCIDVLRARTRRTWIDISDLELHDETPTPLEALSTREAFRVASQVIQEMPDHCRDLWQLLRQGLSYDDMSRHLGVPAGTLRVRVLRCRRQAQEVRDRLQGNKPCNEVNPTSTRKGES